MESTELRTKLSGVIAFPITPFKTDLALDPEGLRHNLTQLVQHPICAVVAAGGTGEMYSLTANEHLAVIKTTIEVIAGRVPVIAGVGFGQQPAVEMARAAADAGASGVLVFPPYYPQADDEGLYEYYRAIGQATPLGMFIYRRDWANFSPSMVERLTTIPTLIGWKDGQGDIRRLQTIMNRVGDRLHWIGGAGDDMVPAYYSIGIRTYTSSIANIAPKLSLALHDKASTNGSAALNQMMSSCVLPLYAFRSKRRGYEVSAMKSIMDLMHLSGGPVRPPLLNVKPEELPELQRIFEAYKPWL